MVQINGVEVVDYYVGGCVHDLGIAGPGGGGGTCTIYMYGRSAERLLSLTWPILKEFRASAGSYLITRCGDSDEEERRIPLDGE